MSRRPLPAAVLDEDDPRARNAARVVPRAAKRRKFGSAVLGYEHAPTRAGDVVANVRASEVERLIQARHHGACDSDDGTVYVAVAAAALMSRYLLSATSSGDPLAAALTRFRSWCQRHVPLVPAHEADAIALEALSRDHDFTADDAAKRLGVRLEERTQLSLTTIGAVDCDAEARRELRRQRDRERKRAQRSATPRRVPLTVSRPWEALGISRRTWERRGRPAADANPVRSKYECIGADASCVTAVRPKRPRIRKLPTLHAEVHLQAIAERCRSMAEGLRPLALAAQKLQRKAS